MRKQWVFKSTLYQCLIPKKAKEGSKLWRKLRDTFYNRSKTVFNFIFFHIISHKLCLFLSPNFCLVVIVFFKLVLLIYSNRSSQYLLDLKIITLHSSLVQLLQSVLGVIFTWIQNQGKMKTGSQWIHDKFWCYLNFYSHHYGYLLNETKLDPALSLFANFKASGLPSI